MNAPLRRLWGAPIVLGAMTSIGLLSALLGDGLWDAVSAVMLSAPLLVAAWCTWKRPAA
jgi:hypothetical protein